MNQWGFYFDQSRCVGCKACMLACKNWNDLKRGDAKINELILKNYEVGEGEMEKEEFFVDSEGHTNYEYYRRFYMKENWRRVEPYERGGTVCNTDYTFSSTFDRRYMSLSCNHCDNPACADACPASNIEKDADTGIVLAGDNCISCGRCLAACPWNAPQFYDDIGKYAASDANAPKMTKCTLCYDRITSDKKLKPACVAACWNRALDAGPLTDLNARYGSAVNDLPEFKRDEAYKPNILFKSK